MYTTMLVLAELDIDPEGVQKVIPAFRTQQQKDLDESLDTSIRSKMFLCPVHMKKLIALVER